MKILLASALTTFEISCLDIVYEAGLIFASWYECSLPCLCELKFGPLPGMDSRTRCLHVNMEQILFRDCIRVTRTNILLL